LTFECAANSVGAPFIAATEWPRPSSRNYTGRSALLHHRRPRPGRLGQNRFSIERTLPRAVAKFNLAVVTMTSPRIGREFLALPHVFLSSASLVASRLAAVLTARFAMTPASAWRRIGDLETKFPEPGSGHHRIQSATNLSATFRRAGLPPIYDGHRRVSEGQYPAQGRAWLISHDCW